MRNAWILGMAVLFGCGGPPASGTPDGAVDAAIDGQAAPIDSGQDGGPVVLCAQDRDCDDGLYCTGVERCLLGDPAAGPDGCVAGTSPCTAGEVCNEDGDRCDRDDCATPDADNDGDNRIGCGGGDCDDDDNRVNSTRLEICDAAGLDEDCNPLTIQNETTHDGDADRDGFVSVVCFNGDNRGTDCRDDRPTANPSGAESCNGVDDDCDGEIDDGVLLTFYRDTDGDGYGRAEDGVQTGCVADVGYVPNGGDCDETSARARSVNPAASEACNGYDDNCDGSSDPGCACTDGATQACGPPEPVMGECRRSSVTCVAGMWPTDCPGAVYPATSDPCGGGDEDCDGSVDEDGVITFYRDADADGEGRAGVTMLFCAGSEPAGWVLNSDDCDDGNRLRARRLTETCDEVDNDCDGVVDDGVQTTYYRDQDGDTYGNPNVTQRACAAPAGYVASPATDCDDALATVNPAATEACNGRDDDCDTMVDPGCMCTDGMTRTCGPVTDVGACVRVPQTCTGGMWLPSCTTAVYPAAERCGGGDADCDGLTDDADPDIRNGDPTMTGATRYYQDSDGDGRGNPAVSELRCGPRSGYVTFGDDCDDTNPSRSPILVEGNFPCDGLDNNCNGVVDEAGLNPTRFYADADLDGYGTASSSVLVCPARAPTGYVPDSRDCADNNSSVHPGAGFQTSPYCVSGATPGSLNCGCVFVGGMLVCEPLAWDYDCSSAVEHEFGAGGCGGGIPCRYTPGFVGMPTPGQCGTSQPFVTGCSATCTSSTANRVVRCR